MQQHSFRVSGPTDIIPMDQCGTWQQVPTAHEWSQHKGTIVKLYKEKGYGLPFVRQYMHRHHNFRASPKMYKDRFRTWGVRKNAQRKPEAPGNYDDDDDDDNDKVAPIQPIVGITYTPDRKTRPPPPLLPSPHARIVFFQGSLDGPKAFQAALHAAHEHIAAQTPESLSRLDPSPLALERGARMAAAARLIRAGDLKPGFSLLEVGFQDFAAAGNRAEVETPYVIGFAPMALLTAGEDLFVVWLRFVAGLVAARSGGGGAGFSGGGQTAPMVRYKRAVLALGEDRESIRSAACALLPRIAEIKRARLKGQRAPESQVALLGQLARNVEALMGDDGAWIDRHKSVGRPRGDQG